MSKLKLSFFVLLSAYAFAGCNSNNVIDTNVAIAENNWAYAKSVKAEVEIKDAAQAYNVYFKLRHTADYLYSNIYVVTHLKGDNLHKVTRYQFKVARADGEWTGKGSGNIFTHNFPLLTNYHFPKAGKYTIEIEQNMRDNPLAGISDVGITVAKIEK